nr:protein kinase-like domain-containing protein [Tanacetum cinerariifolium]
MGHPIVTLGDAHHLQTTLFIRFRNKLLLHALTSLLKRYGQHAQKFQKPSTLFNKLKPYVMSNIQSIIHVNMKSSKIWLNHNWEPTLHGLRADMFVKKHDVHHPNNYDGLLQYTDPAYGKTKALSHKSDVYSFRVVLFEVLLRRVASILISNEDSWSFAQFSCSHYKRKTLNDVMDPVLRQQMDSQSLTFFRLSILLLAGVAISTSIYELGC